jgi:hypothetical protein
MQWDAEPTRDGHVNRLVIGARASGGSRTRNPRITNAVLCQLKLRWRFHGRRRENDSPLPPR